MNKEELYISDFLSIIDDDSLRMLAEQTFGKIENFSIKRSAIQQRIMFDTLDGVKHECTQAKVDGKHDNNAIKWIAEVAKVVPESYLNIYIGDCVDIFASDESLDSDYTNTLVQVLYNEKERRLEEKIKKIEHSPEMLIDLCEKIDGAKVLSVDKADKDGGVSVNFLQDGKMNFCNAYSINNTFNKNTLAWIESVAMKQEDLNLYLDSCESYWYRYIEGNYDVFDGKLDMLKNVKDGMTQVFLSVKDNPNNCIEKEVEPIIYGPIDRESYWKEYEKTLYEKEPY